MVLTIVEQRLNGLLPTLVAMFMLFLVQRLSRMELKAKMLMLIGNMLLANILV